MSQEIGNNFEHSATSPAVEQLFFPLLYLMLKFKLILSQVSLRWVWLHHYTDNVLLLLTILMLVILRQNNVNKLYAADGNVATIHIPSAEPVAFYREIPAKSNTKPPK